MTDVGQNSSGTPVVPDYAQREPGTSWRKVRRILIRMFILALLAAYVYSAFQPAGYRWHICSSCGRSFYETEYRLPLTPIPIWHTHSEKDTRLSAVMRKHGLPAGHVHSPVFVHGGESTFLIRSRSSGQNQMASNAHDGIAVDFLDHLLALDKQAGEKWAGRILTQPTALGISGMLMDRNYFPQLMTTKERFAAWWAAHEKELEETYKDISTKQK